MAKFVATDYNITINGTPFSSSLAALTLEITSEEQDVSSFGGTFRSRIGGLKDASLTLDFHQDFGAGGLATYVSEAQVGTLGTVVIIAGNGTAASSTTPAYTAVCLVSSVTPVAGAVGDLSTFSVTWPTSGEITKATA